MKDRKRVLITGAAGFLGSHLCDRLLARSLHVLLNEPLATEVQNDLASIVRRRVEQRPGQHQAYGSKEQAGDNRCGDQADGLWSHDFPPE